MRPKLIHNNQLGNMPKYLRTGYYANCHATKAHTRQLLYQSKLSINASLFWPRIYCMDLHMDLSSPDDI